MWFGTRDGLSRYDSQHIKNYYFKTKSPRHETNTINCVYASGRELWVGTPVGLFRYLFDKDRFEPVALGTKPVFVSGIQKMSTGELWINGTGGIYKLGPQGRSRHILPKQNIHSVCEFRRGTYLTLEGNKPRLINAEGDTVLELTVDEASRDKLTAILEYDLYKDRHGSVWLGTNRGLLQLDEKTMQFRSVEWFNRLTNSKTWVTRTITEDQLGSLWVGSESGAVVIDSNRQTAQWYDKSFINSPYKLNDRAVYSSYVSRDGTIWIGTYFGGVNYAKPAGISFSHLFPAPDGQSIAGNAVSQLTTDAKNRLWIATEDAGVTVHDPVTDQYTFYNRKNGLSDNNVHALWIDKSNVAWVGTLWGGLNRIDLVSGAVTVYRHKADDPASISNNAVYTVFRDQTNTVWIGTSRGLNILEEKTGRFRLFRPDLFGKTFINEVREDAAGQLWIATHSKGIYRYDRKSGRLTQYTAQNTPAMQSDQIISIYVDSKQMVWFGSIDGGVSLWSGTLKKFIPPPMNAWLLNPTVYGILEDNQGTYWFSTNRGLMSFNPALKTYRHFDKSNGLQVTQFNFKSFLKDEQGLLYFGTVDGLCYFDPIQIKKQVSNPPVYFTELKLFNKVVATEKESVLTKHIDETEKLVLEYSQNVITLDFVAINYFAKGASQYTYYLEGFETGWNPKTTVNSRTYTNLSPGTYTFHVRSFRSNGELSPTERTLQLVIRPPFWQSPLAWFIYLLLVGGALVAYRRFITFLNRQKVAVQMERVERQKSEELNQQKLNFFTFLSNEFKTPITLIMAEIDELTQVNRAWQTDSTPNYGIIRKNAKRLHTLIDQITELRKTSHEPQRVNLTEQDVVAFMKKTVQGFAPLFQLRTINKWLTFRFPYLMALFDAGKLEMIVGNMLYFLTNELGEGNDLSIEIALDQNASQLDCYLVVGFLFSDQPELLQRLKSNYQVAEYGEEFFNQSDSSNIGILLTFSLMKLISGSVLFTDDRNSQVISIRFPIKKSPVHRADNAVRKSYLLPAPVNTELADVATETNSITTPDEAVPTDKSTILIIDRSRDLTQFLKRHFQGKYQIIMVGTFDKALSTLETALPDLVLCDSEIRGKNNQHLCAVLKANPLTQTIPVILLLNDNDEKTIIDGLKSGADAYISKPFNLKELDLMIANRLQAVLALKNKLVGGLVRPGLSTLPVRNKEQDFVVRFYDLVRQHYKGKDLTTDSLAAMMHCSRSQLHTKLRALTEISPKEYLNTYRLNIAHQLLESGMSVAEVAYEVGFGNPDYFGRAFKKKFGINPKAVSCLRACP